jgi:hypothetical protein
MKRLKNSTGFSVIEALLLLIVVGILGFTGWFLYHSQKVVTKDYTSTKTNTQPTSTIKLNKTYVDQTGNFTVKYPSTWKTQTSTSTQGGADYPITSTTLTSPAGTTLHLRSDWGGFGGGPCIPAATDAPFKAGNKCVSWEYLSSETLPIHSVYYASDNGPDASGEITFSYKPSTIVLTTMHYSDPQGASQYIIGITSSNPADPVVLNKPIMGINRPETFFDVQGPSGKSYPLIYVYASGANASFLKSKDATTVDSILKTMVVNLPQ